MLGFFIACLLIINYYYIDQINKMSEDVKVVRSLLEKSPIDEVKAKK